MKTSILVFTIFCIFLFMQMGCEPESYVQESPQSLIIDTASPNYTFKKNISKVVYASVFGSTLTNYKLDLNQDTIDDIEFSCSVYHHTIFDQWYADISTLNDSVLIDIVQDTIQYADYSIKYFNNSSDSITIYYKENYNPSKQYPFNLKIVSQIVNFPKIHLSGDTLNQSGNWKPGKFSLEYDDHTYGGIQYNIQSGIWRNIDHKFVGIMFVEKSIPYYGWIELGVDNYNIALYKYAVNIK